MFNKSMSTALGAIALAGAVGFGVTAAQAGGLPADEGSLKDTGYAAPAPAPLWTGFYIGVHAGYADGEWDGTLDVEGGPFTPAQIGYDSLDKTVDGDGFFGGGQIGYNLQRGRFVFGLEADASFSDVDGSETFTTSGFNQNNLRFAKKHEFEVDYFGTLRGRLGYATDRFMVYATGGFAWAEVDGGLTVTVLEDGEDPYDELSGSSVDKTHTGYTIGGGVEAALNERWSLKAEYLYIDLGGEDYRFSPDKVTRNGAPKDGPADEFNDVDLDMHTFKIGLNYRVGSVREPMEPLK